MLRSGLSRCLGEKGHVYGGGGGGWGVTGNCVSGEGGYGRLSSSPKDTSHTSLVGSGKENGSYVCHGSEISHKHTHTHTSIPITPLLSLELTS